MHWLDHTNANAPPSLGGAARRVGAATRLLNIDVTAVSNKPNGACQAC